MAGVPSSIERLTSGAFRRAVAVVAMFALASCSRDAAARRADREELVAVTARDADLDSLLAQVDARTKVDSRGAARALRSEGARLAREAVGRAATVPVRSRWGARHREALEQIAREREASIEEYALALDSGDSERVVAALRAQADLDHRALTLAAELARPD